MELKGKKYLILYLTDWQKRMVKDFLNISCDYWKVPINDPNVKYGLSTSPEAGYKKMYLTDWQIREIRTETGTCCDYVELKKGVQTLYGIGTP
jgi:hypothetical protein